MVLMVPESFFVLFPKTVRKEKSPTDKAGQLGRKFDDLGSLLLLMITRLNPGAGISVYGTVTDAVTEPTGRVCKDGPPLLKPSRYAG